MLQLIDERLRDGTVLMLASSNVGSSLGIEGLGALNQQTGTCQLVPAVPLTQQLTCALVEDEVQHAVVVARSADGIQHGHILCGQLCVAGNLQVGGIGGLLNACREVVGVGVQHGGVVGLRVGKDITCLILVLLYAGCIGSRVVVVAAVSLEEGH